MKILTAFILCIAASIISFIQLQGQIAWKFPKDNPYLMMLLGLPISLIFINTTRIFNEHPTPKTIVCLGLASLIVALQVFWKN